MNDSREGRDCKHGHLARACEICELEAKLAAAEEELTRFRNGYKGSCYTCEAVGEKNVELEDNVRVLREAADALRDYERDSLAAQLEAAAESLYTTGTDADSDQDTVQFTAYLEGLLEAEREKVRVLREALYMLRNDWDWDSIHGEYSPSYESRVKADEALATTAPEGGEV